jgi:hypothetical protein
VLYFNHPSVRNDHDFGKRLGVSGTTIRNWAGGEKSRPRDLVGIDRLDDFVEIFRSRLPGNRSASEVLAILASKNVMDLLSAFTWDHRALAWVASMHAATSGGIRILDRGPSDAFGITSRRRPYDAVDDGISFLSRHDFQFEFPSPVRDWVLILQHTNGGWYCADYVSIASAATVTLLPTVEPYFSESDEIDCIFSLLQSPVPLPPHLHLRLELSAKKQSLIDISTLELLGHFATSTSGFRVNSIHVSFMAESPIT